MKIKIKSLDKFSQNYEKVFELTKVIDLDEDEQERILEIWDNEYYGSDKDYMYWNEDFGEYDKDENVDGEYDERNFDALEDEDDENDFFGNEDEDDEDLSEFLDDFFDDDEDE